MQNRAPAFLIFKALSGLNSTHLWVHLPSGCRGMWYFALQGPSQSALLTRGSRKAHHMCEIPGITPITLP